MDRKKAPVFTLGSPRSGTTLLYHMLLSAGGFAIYRTESNVFNLLVPRFRDLSKRRNKKKLMNAWLGSKLFSCSGLDRADIEAKVMAECKNGGDFLRIVMGEIARSQGVDRWADCTPEHLLYLREIKKEIPEAKVIHIIRDGRDVAMSMEKQGWIRPFPWEKKQNLLIAALYWEWIVQRGREYGRTIAPDYIEVHFEDLIKEPRKVLTKLGQFIDHDLDYERIQRVAIGSVGEPNTSFKGGSAGGTFNPVGRWKTSLPEEELARLECLVGPTLESLGYPLTISSREICRRFHLNRLRTLHLLSFNSKLWLKKNISLSRYLVTKDLSWL
jgi:hypothetical protein